MELWVWVRVPVRALERAIAALKDAVVRKHRAGEHADADQDDRAAEAIKRSLREDDDAKR